MHHSRRKSRRFVHRTGGFIVLLRAAHGSIFPFRCTGRRLDSLAARHGESSTKRRSAPEWISSHRAFQSFSSCIIMQAIKQQNAPPAVGRREREALVTGGQVQNILPAQQSLGERGLTEAAGALKKRTRAPAMKRSKRSAMADLMMISGSFHPP